MILRYLLVCFVVFISLSTGVVQASATGSVLKFILDIPSGPAPVPTPPAYGKKLFPKALKKISSKTFTKDLVNLPVVKADTLDRLESNVSKLIVEQLYKKGQYPGNRRYNRWFGSAKEAEKIVKELLFLNRPVSGGKAWALEDAGAYQKYLVKALKSAEYISIKSSSGFSLPVSNEKKLDNWVRRRISDYQGYVRRLLKADEFVIRLVTPYPEQLIKILKDDAVDVTGLDRCARVEARDLARKVIRADGVVSPINNFLWFGVSEWSGAETLEETLNDIANSMADKVVAHATSGLEGRAAQFYKLYSAIDISNGSANINVDGPCGYQTTINLNIEKSPILKDSQGKQILVPELNFFIKNINEQDADITHFLYQR